MADLEEHEKSGHRHMTPATPPKPRIWDDENAFDAFEVEDSTRNIDFMITTCHSQRRQDNGPSTARESNHHKQAQNSKKPKISMGHVEFLMSELENSKLMMAPKGWNRFQIRCSTDELSNLTIEEIEENHSILPSSNQRVLNQVKSREQNLSSYRPHAHDSSSGRIWNAPSSHDSDQKPAVDKIEVGGQLTGSSAKDMREYRYGSNSTSTPSISHAFDQRIADELDFETKPCTEPAVASQNSPEPYSQSRIGSAEYDGDDDHESEQEDRLQNHSYSRRPTTQPSSISSTRGHTLTPTRSSNSPFLPPHAPDSRSPVPPSPCNYLENSEPGGFIRESVGYRSRREERLVDDLPVVHALEPTCDLNADGNNHENLIPTVSLASPSDQESQQELITQSRSSGSFRLQRSPSLVSELQGLDSTYLANRDGELAKGGQKLLTSTPQGVVRHPSPFPVKIPAKPVPPTSSNERLLFTCPMVEIASVDPKVAARAAAILKVHHGFIPRGCKVENSTLFNDDQLEREIESSIRKEQADRSLRLLHHSSTPYFAAPQNLLRTLQTKSTIQNNQNNNNDGNRDDDHQDLSSSSLSPGHDNLSDHSANDGNLQIFSPHHDNRHSKISPSSSSSLITPISQEESSRKTDSKEPVSISKVTTEQKSNNTHDNRKHARNHNYYNRKRTLKEELKHMNYQFKFDSWTHSDWKILEHCLKKTEREELGSLKNRIGNSREFVDVQPEDVVLRWLDALGLDRFDCQLEWEWTKMIHRVIALKKRRWSEPGHSSKRSRAGSSSNGSSHRCANQPDHQTVRRHHDLDRNKCTPSPTRSKATTTEPISTHQANQVGQSLDQTSDACGPEVYPSLEPIRRLFSKSRSGTPTSCEGNKNAQKQNQGVSDKPDKFDNTIQSHPGLTTTATNVMRKVPRPPPISRSFREQYLKRVQSYWDTQVKSRRRVGHGKIWKTIEALEDQIERNFAKLIPPSQHKLSFDCHERPRRKRALDGSSELVEDSEVLNNLSESSGGLYHPSFGHDSYSENHRSHSPQFKRHRKS